MSKKIRIILAGLAATIAIVFPSQKAFAYPTTSRIYGEDRYQTAWQISKAGWNTSLYAVIACGENFPDALSAAPLAKKYNAPILLTYTNSLNSYTKQRLSEMNTKFVFIVGGTGVVSEVVENEIRSMGIDVTRLAGADRYETSLKVAESLDNVSQIAVTTGESFYDAASIGPVAARDNMPIILMPKDYVFQDLRNFIKKKNITKTYVIGESDVISNKVTDELPNVERITGSDAYIRNENVIKKFYSGYSKVFMASGIDFPDAITGTVISANNNAPLVILNNSDMNIAKNIILGANAYSVNIIGGTGVIPESTVNYIIDDNIISFTDSNLENAVRKSLGIDYFSYIYKSQLYNLTKLDATANNITNLSGIENLVNLKELYLGYNNIKELAPLSRLNNLTVLELQDNNINDISSLSSLYNLSAIRLDSNKISDISSIGNLLRLNKLDLRHNNIGNISSLSSLTNLKELFLNDNNVINYSAVGSYYNRLSNKDFDLQIIPSGSIGITTSVNIISSKDMKLINSFETLYNCKYDEYSIIYRSNDYSSYEGDFDKLNKARTDTLDKISDMNSENYATKTLNETLEDIYNKINTLQNYHEMNKYINQLEGALNIASIENDKKTIRNKINLTYSEYMERFYQDEINRCANNIGTLESELLSLQNNISDVSNARANEIRNRLSSLNSDRNFLQDKLNKYSNLYSFYNAIDYIFNNETY